MFWTLFDITSAAIVLAFAVSGLFALPILLSMRDAA